ncbi:hypothetical protein [Seleniivibrio sp.]|uniref:hypothetical protein n=1 Tax=Seleniivibrio sp. TaxID=2898801 RepID=UPI0025E92F0B|nr:hypothetical protein [Seleniivibrio sp.]MCD8554301.1 hypothetical protein [Seleniivibrio sp.]
MDIYSICTEIIDRYRFKEKSAKNRLIAICRNRLDGESCECENILRSDIGKIKEHLHQYFHMPRFSKTDELDIIIRAEADNFLHCLDDFDDIMTTKFMKAIWEIYLTERIFVSAKGVENSRKYSSAVYSMF